MPQPNDPGLRVVSREFSEELGGCLVIETAQAGVIVVGNEGVEVGIAFGVVAKAAMVGGAVLRQPVEMLAKAAVGLPGRAAPSPASAAPARSTQLATTAHRRANLPTQNTCAGAGSFWQPCAMTASLRPASSTDRLTAPVSASISNSSSCRPSTPVTSSRWTISAATRLKPCAT